MNKLLTKIGSNLRAKCNDWSQKTFAQEGEDLVLKEVFSGVKNGFYVDVGAHHPSRFSNTYLLYKNGWRGINIDASPQVKRLFDQKRPEDTNIEAAVGYQEKRVVFNVYNETALNSIKDRQFSKSSGYKKIDQYEVIQKPLNDILNQNLPINKEVDLYSIDVEGHEMEVLKSNDWSKHSPAFIIIEDHIAEFASLTSVAISELSKYLEDKNYYPFARTLRNTFFKRQD